MVWIAGVGRLSSIRACCLVPGGGWGRFGEQRILETVARSMEDWAFCMVLGTTAMRVEKNDRLMDRIHFLWYSFKEKATTGRQREGEYL